MTKIKMLRFTTDLNVITPAVEHPIQEWLDENKGISVVSVASSSREIIDGGTWVLAWDIAITYEPKKKLARTAFYSGYLSRRNHEEQIAEIEKWRKRNRIDIRDIISIQVFYEHYYGLQHGPSNAENVVTYLVEDTDG